MRVLEVVGLMAVMVLGPGRHLFIRFSRPPEAEIDDLAAVFTSRGAAWLRRMPISGIKKTSV